jgi:hypothetical protein
MRRSRQGGQAIVEFGLIALLFTLLMFAVVDFGLLLNDWLTVAADTQQLARDAAVGAYTGDCTPWPNCQTELDAKASLFPIPGVTADAIFGGNYCCTPTSALVLSVTYYQQCTPGVLGCVPVDPATLDNRYSTTIPPSTTRVQGGCTPPLPPATCAHPARPSPAGPGDTVVVTFRAAGAQIITPLVRPFFRDATYCPDTGGARCYVSVSNKVTARFDGARQP